MPGTQPDHRGKRRVRSKLRATVRTDTRSISAETRDISTGGMFLYADGAFPVGSEIQIVLMLPRELGLITDRMVCCHATVLRIEPPTPDGRQGIAAMIDRFALMNQV
jgi:c-di-GMP-binding flagellar brake protein YcgR